ncbi:MAG: DUF983 domain-containing protein [Rhodospirillales bacterium]|nr:DUF983 domain-containing protein [Rhodospirillales bacterium]
MLKNQIVLGLRCKCPRCGQGDLYESRWSLAVRRTCPDCGLDLTQADSADGPAVFLIFVLGASLVPLALIFETVFAPPLWVHAVLWGAVALGFTIGSLRPLKAFVVALQYKHRPWDGA